MRGHLPFHGEAADAGQARFRLVIEEFDSGRAPDPVDTLEQINQAVGGAVRS